MAKKKATMTLKDFHGGSIPSDLPLPSAPGVIARPSNHAGFDRQTSWGNPMGRQDHRLRPGSAGAARTYDDKTPFLTPTVQIGRNFDEDERKPLDGVSAPRRTFSDESIRGGVPVFQEPKLDFPLAGNVPSRPATTPVSQVSSGSTSPHASRFSQAANVGVNSQNVSSGRSYSKTEGKVLRPNGPNVGVVNSGPALSGPSPNAWGLRKETVGVSEPVATSWSAPDAATKLAHASALEKVSSGRWHSNQQKQIDVEVIRHLEPEAEVPTKGNTYSTFSYNSVDGREFHDTSMASHVERSLTINDGIPGGAQELPSYERGRSFTHPDIKERNPSMYKDGLQVPPPRSAGTFGGSELRTPTPSESSERPKLKLLPRSKPVENSEHLVAYKQAIPQPNEPSLVDAGNETYENANSTEQGLAGPEGAFSVVERPKLNLRPRSQPIEQLERNMERERKTLFGGARPRELVLKERGVDDVAVNHDMIQSPDRSKKETPRPDNLPAHPTVTSRQTPKVELQDHHRPGKNVDKRDTEKSDPQRRSNWRTENRKSSRDLEKPPQDRPPSPETWRKPVEPTPPSAGPRYGKAASAVELAQAFSKSVSDPKVATDRFPGQRSLPGPAEIPFSRLTSQPTRAHINGY